MSYEKLFCTEAERVIICSILSASPYTFYAYGSRVKGNPRPFSDLDLCYREAIPPGVLADLSARFEESDLPFKVEINNWQDFTDDFKNLIEKDLCELN